jgi:hypothetical protein
VIDAWLWPLFLLPGYAGYAISMALLALAPPCAVAALMPMPSFMTSDQMAMACLVFGVIWGALGARVVDESYLRFRAARAARGE